MRSKTTAFICIFVIIFVALCSCAQNGVETSDPAVSAPVSEPDNEEISSQDEQYTEDGEITENFLMPYSESTVTFNGDGTFEAVCVGCDYLGGATKTFRFSADGFFGNRNRHAIMYYNEPSEYMVNCSMDSLVKGSYTFKDGVYECTVEGYYFRFYDYTGESADAFTENIESLVNDTGHPIDGEIKKALRGEWGRVNEKDISNSVKSFDAKIIERNGTRKDYWVDLPGAERSLMPLRIIRSSGGNVDREKLYEYYGDGYLKTEIEYGANGGENSHFEYEYEYYDNGEKKSTLKRDVINGGELTDKHPENEYDESGKLIKSVLKSGNRYYTTEEYDYYESGKLKSVTKTATSISADGQKKESSNRREYAETGYLAATWSYSDGVLESITECDEKGFGITQYIYDENGNVKSVKSLGTSGITTAFEYKFHPESGRIKSVAVIENGALSSVTEYAANGDETRYAKYGENGETTLENIFTYEYEYFPEGFVKNRTVYMNGEPCVILDFYENGYLKRFEYRSDGIQEGVITDYAENGKTLTTSTCYPSGAIRARYDYYESGVMRSSVTYYENGEILHQADYPDDN